MGCHLPHRTVCVRRQAVDNALMSLTLREADYGTTATVRPGEAIALELAENPTTGYRWHVEVTGDALAQTSATYTPAAAGIGAGGQRATTFTAVRPGTSVIRASLRRPWESSDKALQDYEVRVNVKGEHDDE